MTLTGTRWQSCRCCFLCSGGFWRGPTSRPLLLLLSCCCVLSASPRSGRQALLLHTHSHPPGRTLSGPLPPHFPKNRDFPEENFSRPEVFFQSCILGVAALGIAQFGDLCLYQSVGKISGQASEEVRPSRNFTESFSVAVKAE